MSDEKKDVPLFTIRRYKRQLCPVSGNVLVDDDLSVSGVDSRVVCREFDKRWAK